MTEQKIFKPEDVSKEIRSRLGNLSNRDEILNKKGEILYSLLKTLTKGSIYVVGLNPGNGGEDENISNEQRQRPKWTLKEELDNKIAEREKEYKETGRSWSAYDDKLERQSQKFQDNAKKFFKFIFCKKGVDEKDIDKEYVDYKEKIFATNAIFETSYSANAKNFECNYKNFINYWPVHIWFLDIIKPKVIVCIGYGDSDSPFYFFRKAFDVNKNKVVFENSKNFKYKYFDVCDNNGNFICRVFGFKHFSSSIPTGYTKFAANTIRKYLNEDKKNGR